MKPMKRLQLGKNGLSEAFVNQVRNIFDDAEVVKVTILRSACRNKEEAKTIAEGLMNSLGPKFAYTLIGYVMTVRRFRKNQR